MTNAPAMTNVIPLRATIPQWTLAERLRKVRREKKLSQEVFAARLGVKPGTYSAWETGRNVPDRIDELAETLEMATGVSRLWFLGWADSGPSDPNPGQSVTGAYQTSRNPRTGGARITPIRGTVETTVADQDQDQDVVPAAAAA